MKTLKYMIRSILSSVALLISVAVLADAPVASNLSITPGTYTPGDVIAAGTYDYDDADGDPESGTVISWYTNTSPSETGASYAGLETGSGFTVTAGHRGLYVAMAVIPGDGTAESPGAIAYSNWVLVNSLPQANDDDYINLEDEGEDLTVALPGVLSNDTDSESGTQTFSATVAVGPDYGELTLNPNGSFVYSHDGSENLTDNFTYTISDGIESGNTATVNIQMRQVNDAPVFTSDSVTTATEGVGYIYNITTSDAENNSRTISYVDLMPTWLTLTDYGNGTGRLAGTPDNDDVGTHDVHLRVSDGSLFSDQVFQIEVSNINDAPVLSGIEPSVLPYEEDEPAKVISQTITVNDIDNDSLVSATISIISGLVPDEDRLTFTASPPLSTLYDQPNGILTISGKAPVATYQTALRNVKYYNANTDDPNDGNRVVRFVVNDGTIASNTLNRTIDFTAVNDPANAQPDNYFNVPEGGSLTTTAGVDGVLDNDEDLDGPLALTAYLVQDVSNGYLDFYANGSFTYDHDSSNVLSDEFTYYAWDGANRSDTVSVIISMLQVNDAPVLENIPEDTLTFTEDGDPRIIVPNVLLTDEDDTEVESATITIDQGYVMGEDSLVFQNVSGLAIEFDTLSGVLTATGTASLAVYQNSLLRNVSYWNTNTEDPNDQFRRVTFTINDGDTDSDPVSRVIEVVPVNDPPEATEATLIGTYYYVDELITIDYEFSDPDGDAEGNTTFRWYTAEDADGTGRAPLSVPQTDTFTTRFSEGGLYLSGVVRPLDNQGEVGVYDTTEWRYIDAAPEFQDFNIINEVHPGVFADGEIVKAEFTYFDLEDDGEGTHEFQWYRSNTASWDDAGEIAGATLDSFEIRPQDRDRYIGLEGTPLALDGSSPGDVYRSPLYLVSELPFAVLSGGDSICPGLSDTLLVNLTGAEPWSFRYVIEGTTDTIPVINVSESSYKFAVTDTGRYLMVDVSDNQFDFGVVGGEAVVAFYQEPTAVILDPEVTICGEDEETYQIPVQLTGKAPWQISYQYDQVSDSSHVVNIDTAYFGIDVTVADIGNYELLHVWDANCMSPGTGAADVLQKDSPLAFMTGDTSICPGDTAVLSIELSGVGPWSVSYTRDQGEVVKDTIDESGTSYIYQLKVADPGLYELVGVVDAEDAGCVNGAINVEHYIQPTATIGGTERACEGSAAEFEVTLAGEAPWTLVCQHNTEDPDTVFGIELNPYPLSASEAGNYTILEVQDQHCAGPGQGVASLVIDPLPDVDILGLEEKYSIQTNDVLMNVEPEGGDFQLSDFPNAIWPRDGEWYFIPSYAYINHGSPFWIRYSWEDPTTGCVGTAEERVIIITSAAEIQIDNEKEMYCFNDDTILVEGFSIRDNIGSFSITNNEGLEDLGNNKAHVFPSIIEEGQTTITYTVEVDGEMETAQKVLSFNKIEGDFTWDTECLTDDTQVLFSDASTSSYGDFSWDWKFYFPDDTITANTNDTTIRFRDLEPHNIEYIVSASFNEDVCRDTVRKVFTLKPTFKMAGSIYSENFAIDTAYWTSMASDGGQNSWTFGTPVGGPWGSVPESEKAWYTDIVDHQETENSYLISPCFDFTDAKPMMIKLSLWRGFSNEIDGAVLQFTTDNGLNWQSVGSLEDGINWYNVTNIIGQPGGQTVGWTSQDADNDWIEARHKLDIPQLMDSSNVRFRIAYGATGIAEEDNHGLAVDNIWIGERKKKVLFEYFTNSADEFCEFVNSEVNSLFNAPENSYDIIDIQYHLGEPEFGHDPFYDLNPEYTNSRKFYYNVQNVPYGIIDGGRGSQAVYQFKFTDGKELEQDQLTRAALEDPLFDIGLQVNPQANSFNVDVDVVAREDIPSSNLILHFVVVESVITEVTGENGETSFESVFKTMLPDAIGTRITRSWDVGDVESYLFEYLHQDVYNDSALRAIAFVQDVATKEVYQAAIVNPFPVTGLRPNQVQTRQFDIFPNPAIEFAYLKIKEPVSTGLIIEVLDINGRLVYEDKFYGGQEYYKLPLGELRDGIYSIRVSDKDKFLGTGKLIKLGAQ